MDLDNFQVRRQYGVASLCNQLLPEFSSNQFETFHRCDKHIEDVHVTLSRQENHFLTKLRHFRLISFYSHNTNMLPRKHKISYRYLKSGIEEFHSKFVLVPADKAANNVVVV